MRAKRPILAIVGAGRTGRALGKLLRRRGWPLGAVVTRSLPSARAAVRAIGGGRPMLPFAPAVLDAGVVLIATPDDAIADVARKLARIQGGAREKHPWRGKVVLHTSGALDSSVLRPLGRRGAAVGSLHPLQTFSGRAVPPLAGCIFALEGTAAARRVARRICRDLGGVPVVIGSGAKPAYHAAGALAAGHVLAVEEAALCILVRAGFPRRLALRALLPLTRQVLDNLERLGPRQPPREIWTGPLRRGDFATVRKHAAALRRFPREYGDAYAALSRLALLVLGKGSHR